MSTQVFQAAAAADYVKLAELLIAMPEKDRRAIHDQLVEKTLARAVERSASSDLAARYSHQIARVGTGTAKDYASFWMDWFDRDGRSAPNLAEVFLCRPTNVYQGMARAIFRSGAGFYFVMLFDLLKQGLIDRPPEAQLQTSMLQSIRTNRAVFEQSDAVDVLCGALQDETVIRSSSGFLVDGVTDAVVDGSLPRERLLPDVLRALCRDFKPGVATVFREMFAKLAPTDQELAERVDLLIQMLANGLAPNQTLAAESLLRVNALKSLSDVEAVSNAVRSAIATPQKSTAAAAFRLLQSLNLDSVIRANTAVVGLAHPNSDVQLVALKVLESCGSLSAEILSEALLAEATIAPKLRARLSVLVGVDVANVVAGEPAAGEVSVAARQEQLARRFEQLPTDVRARLGLDGSTATSLQTLWWPRPQAFIALDVPTGRRLEPIGDPEELVDLLLTSAVGSVSALDIDRIVDGVTRLASPAGIAARFDSLKTPELEGLSWSSPALRFTLLRTAFSWSRLQTHGPYPYLAKPSLLSRNVLRHDLKAEPSTRNYFQAFDGGAGLPAAERKPGVSFNRGWLDT
jgi:Family of unknown function (DUF6493)